jgi:Fur family transcriptional regulator, ferric uptake regulator
MDASVILERLKADGHRLTAARRAIVELFQEGCNPQSAQDIQMALAKKRLSPNITTVYRELQFLADQGVLRTVQFEDGVQRYEAAHAHHHHHLVCVNCKTVQEVHAEHDLETMERDIGKTKGFTVLRHTLEFYGICRKCG